MSLLQVINDILDVSRIESGMRQLNESIVDMERCVNSTLQLLSARIYDGKLSVTSNINSETPKIVGEPQAVKQVIANLLSNAIKFTPEGGRITLDAFTDEEGALHINITDTGIGLSDKEMEVALSPFGQADSELSKKESGTGLGLTLVQSLMRLHQGRFELFSQKGIGTTASLIFPPARVARKNRPSGATEGKADDAGRADRTLH